MCCNYNILYMCMLMLYTYSVHLYCRIYEYRNGNIEPHNITFSLLSCFKDIQTKISYFFMNLRSNDGIYFLIWQALRDPTCFHLDINIFVHCNISFFHFSAIVLYALSLDDWKSTEFKTWIFYYKHRLLTFETFSSNNLTNFCQLLENEKEE